MNPQRKEARYQRLYAQIKEQITPVSNPIARMATIAAILHHKMETHFWTGFYLLNAEKELLVGPYQGPVACMKLAKDTGVCWAGINTGKSVVVPDVEQFPGHIACSSLSKSEVVVPVFNQQQQIIGVLDVDSRQLNAFDDVDAQQLEQITALIYNE